MRAEAHWARASPSVRSGAMRSVRPTVPCSRLPPDSSAEGPCPAPDEERLVVVGVPGGVDDLDPEGPDGEHVTAADPDVGRAHRLLGRHEVVGAVAAGQQRGTRDVVVVDVGVGDGHDLDPGLGGCLLHERVVARRVDDQALAAVVDEVAAVAELGDREGDDVHARSSTSLKYN